MGAWGCPAGTGGAGGSSRGLQVLQTAARRESIFVVQRGFGAVRKHADIGVGQTMHKMVSGDAWKKFPDVINANNVSYYCML